MMCLPKEWTRNRVKVDNINKKYQIKHTKKITLHI